MKRLLAVIALTSVTVIGASAQLSTTLGVINGRTWKQTSEAMKIAYVAGIRDGLGISEDKDLDAYRVQTANHGDVVGILDRFFTDPANANVPVVLALGYVRAESEGATPEALAQVSALLRRVAAGKFQPESAPAPHRRLGERPPFGV